MRNLKWLRFAHMRCWKSPFCRAVNHAIVTGKLQNKPPGRLGHVD